MDTTQCPRPSASTLASVIQSKFATEVVERERLLRLALVDLGVAHSRCTDAAKEKIVIGSGPNAVAVPVVAWIKCAPLLPNVCRTVLALTTSVVPVADKEAWNANAVAPLLSACSAGLAAIIDAVNDDGTHCGEGVTYLVRAAVSSVQAGRACPFPILEAVDAVLAAVSPGTTVLWPTAAAKCPARAITDAHLVLLVNALTVASYIAARYAGVCALTDVQAHAQSQDTFLHTTRASLFPPSAVSPGETAEGTGVPVAVPTADGAAGAGVVVIPSTEHEGQAPDATEIMIKAVQAALDYASAPCSKFHATPFDAVLDVWDTVLKTFSGYVNSSYDETLGGDGHGDGHGSNHDLSVAAMQASSLLRVIVALVYRVCVAMPISSTKAVWRTDGMGIDDTVATPGGVGSPSQDPVAAYQRRVYSRAAELLRGTIDTVTASESLTPFCGLMVLTPPIACYGLCLARVLGFKLSPVCLSLCATLTDSTMVALLRQEAETGSSVF